MPQVGKREEERERERQRETERERHMLHRAHAWTHVLVSLRD